LRATFRIDALTFTSMLPGVGAYYRVGESGKRCAIQRFES
jgi:hypothetical protein